jgi:hypothetical protein
VSFSNTAETAVLEYIFEGTNVSWDANTDLWIALYTSTPDEGGSAVTNEVSSYGSYARVAMARATDFTVSGNSVSNANLMQFPACSSGSNVITHAAIVTSSSGAGTVVVYAELNSSITVTTGVQPQFAGGALSFTLD